MATKQERIINKDLQISAFLGRYDSDTIKNYEKALAEISSMIINQLDGITDEQARLQLLRLQESIRIEFQRLGMQAQADLIRDMQETAQAQYQSTVGMMADIFPDIQASQAAAFQMPREAFVAVTDPERLITVSSGKKKKRYRPADEIERITKQSFNKYSKIVGSAVLRGVGNRDIMEELEQSLDIQTSKARAQVQAVTRTTISDGMEKSRIEGFSLFDEVIVGWMWNAVLDNRTSLGCASLNGRVEKRRVLLPRIPRHFNCRSTCSPVTDFDDIENIMQRYHIRDKKEVKTRDGFKETKFKNAETGIKNIKNPIGDPSKSASDVWFDSMPEVEILKNGKEVNWKKEYLGPAKYELYLNHGLKFSDMVADRTLRPLSIKEIRQNLGI